MEQPKYLIDTNAVIDYLGHKMPETGMAFMNTIIDLVPNISVITKIEVLGFNAPEEYFRLLSSFMDDAIVLSLTSDVAETCIGLRRAHKIKLPDAIIAATALVHGLTLLTRNVSDFKTIDGLELVNPHER